MDLSRLGADGLIAVLGHHRPLWVLLFRERVTPARILSHQVLAGIGAELGGPVEDRVQEDQVRPDASITYWGSLIGGDRSAPRINRPAPAILDEALPLAEAQLGQVRLGSENASPHL